MNNKLIIGAGVGAVAAAAAMCARAGCQGEGKQTKWDKMRARMDEMPADFPPRVMFDNVEATRANTDEILSLLRTSPRVDAPEAALVSS